MQIAQSEVLCLVDNNRVRIRYIDSTLDNSGCNQYIVVIIDKAENDLFRFGPIPPETEELLRIVPLRRLAARLGVEKVFLKGGRMTLFFVNNAESPYYQSAAFGKMIDYMMKYTRRCDLREQNGRRSMLVKDIPNVETAVSVLLEIVALPVKEKE